MSFAKINKHRSRIAAQKREAVISSVEYDLQRARESNRAVAHTPGPWQLCEGVTQFENVWDSKGAFKVADFIEGKTKDEANANAHLIAAAPDLLAALEKLADAAEKFGGPNVQKNWPEIALARTVIAKARGKA